MYDSYRLLYGKWGDRLIRSVALISVGFAAVDSSISEDTRFTPAPLALKLRVWSSARRLQLEQPERNIHVWMSPSLSAFSFSTFLKKNSHVIGLPRTMLFTTSSPDDSHMPLIENEPIVTLASPQGRQIRSIFTPSEEHSMFTICHELGHILHYDSHMVVLSTCTFSLLAHEITRRCYPYWLKEYRLPPMLRKPLFARCFFILTGLCTVVTALRKQANFMEYRADTVAATLDRRYALGGIESLEKRIAMNRIIRHSVEKRILMSEERFQDYPVLLSFLVRMRSGIDENGENRRDKWHPLLIDRIHNIKRILEETKFERPNNFK